MDPISGAISAGGNLLSSVVNYFGNRALQREQQAWNEKMQDKQNAWNLEQWNRENEYNSPAAQQQRYFEAGLNPLAMSMDAGNAQQLESAQVLPYQRAEMPNNFNPGASFLEGAMMNAQIDNLNADTAKKGEETLTEVERRQKIRQEVETEKQKLQNMLSDKAYTDVQRAQIEKAIEWYDKIQAANLAYTEAQTKLTESQQKRIDELLEGEKLLQCKSLEDFEHKWDLWLAQAAKDSALAGLTREDIANYGINHFSNGVAGSGISLQNFIRNRFLNYDGSPKKPGEVGKTYVQNVKNKVKKVFGKRKTVQQQKTGPTAYTGR